ncbi:hypothetical protein [Micromonospora sp. WMMD975]|uniref:hypothetical protein n=1 Tax=Micromonospora sp. WMMD975 TaxID=3016087 RepID=UPI00249A43F1|nr:hypothetical protein [Micromonospora sp. WMMD975]WFE34146.1 hypothetical protein O7613_01730 [Micromonospora sp. WMMD975]
MSDVVACPACGGAGCPRCRRRGRRRAQLLLTVANRDTGAVASHLVTPADLDPRANAAGDAVVDLTPRVRDLASAVAVVLDPEPLRVRLPAAWRPELPATYRYALAAVALADAARRPWRLWVGGSTAPCPVDPGVRLAQLCHLADLLLLDLVVTVRRQGDRHVWTVRYEVPGSPVRTGPVEGSADLTAALLRTDARAALAGLTDRGLTAPAGLLEPGPRRSGPASPTSPGPVGEVARRVVAELTDGRPGAQAVWRDGGWWHSGLRYAGSPGRSTARDRTPLRRVTEPPDPSRLGRSGVGASDVSSPLGGSARGRSPAAVLVTVTDLRHRVVHLTWRSGALEVARPVATTPDGRPVVRLPERYRLGEWARVFGVLPEDLAEADGGHMIDRDLRDGYVSLPWVGADPVGEYVRRIGVGRLVVTAARPEVPPLVDVIRLVRGLDLALHVGVLDLRQHAGDPLRPDGRWWSVEVRPRDAPVHPDDLPTRPSLASALDDCLTHLADDLGEMVPPDPDESLPVPGWPACEPAADPVSALLRLAAQHAGRAVTLRLTRAGHTVHRHDGGKEGAPLNAFGIGGGPY